MRNIKHEWNLWTYVAICIVSFSESCQAAKHTYQTHLPRALASLEQTKQYLQEINVDKNCHFPAVSGLETFITN